MPSSPEATLSGVAATASGTPTQPVASAAPERAAAAGTALEREVPARTAVQMPAPLTRADLESEDAAVQLQLSDDSSDDQRGTADVAAPPAPPPASTTDTPTFAPNDGPTAPAESKPAAPATVSGVPADSSNETACSGSGSSASSLPDPLAASGTSAEKHTGPTDQPTKRSIARNEEEKQATASSGAGEGGKVAISGVAKMPQQQSKYLDAAPESAPMPGPPPSKCAFARHMLPFAKHHHKHDHQLCSCQARIGIPNSRTVNRDGSRTDLMHVASLYSSC